MADSSEQTLSLIKEVQVFKIPPRNTSRGYRASDWDVTQHMWSGRLRVVSVGDTCFIKLEDQNGQLFAESKYAKDGSSLEQVIDSSRYFVLRLDDPTTGTFKVEGEYPVIDHLIEGRHAFVGLGFIDRTDSFDFNVALQDHIKHVRVREDALKRSQDQTSGPKTDYSLKQGMIQIQLGNANKKSAAKPAVTESNGDPFTIAPPSAPSNSAPTGWVQF